MNFGVSETIEDADRPVDYADQNCLIWDTDVAQESGVPPSIVLDEEGAPAFLHVLSGDDSNRQEANYFYVLAMI